MTVVSVCLPSDALLQHLPSYLGFSYLGHGYFFMAAPAKCSHCSLPWTRDMFSLPPFLTPGIAPLGPPVSAQARLLGLGVAPPGRCPWPRAWGHGVAVPNLGHWVSPLGGSCAIAVWYSRPLPLTSDVGWLLSAALRPSQPPALLQADSLPCVLPGKPI